MAQAIAGGGYIETPVDGSNPLAISLWMRSSSANRPMEFCSRHNSDGAASSGFEIYPDTGLNTCSFVSKASSTFIVNFTGPGIIMDGNWHHIGINYPQNAGQTVELWLDGVLNGSQTPGSAHGLNPFVIRFGHGVNTFFQNYVGDLAEMACWNTTLTADEMIALGKGFKPTNVKLANLLYYIPGVRAVQETRGFPLNVVSATPNDHPRIYG